MSFPPISSSPTGGGSTTGTSFPPISSGSGGGSKGGKSPGTNPKVQFIRNAVRVARALNRTIPATQQAEGYDPSKDGRISGVYGVVPTARQVAYAQLGELLGGLSQDKIRKIGERAKLPREDLQILMLNSPSGRQANMMPVDPQALAAFSQASLGALVEGRAKQGPIGFDVVEAAKGAARGFTGQKQYRGTAGAYTVYTGGTQKEGREFAESLPAGVRTAGDIVVETVVDPTTWATLGYGAAAKAGAATVAKQAVGQAATEAVLSPAARAVYDDIVRVGLRKGLARHLTAEQADELIKNLPKTVRRQASKARPGVYVAGKRVPGSAGTEASQARMAVAGPKGSSAREVGTVGGVPVQTGREGIVAQAEQALRPRGATRQAERAGTLPRYSTQEQEIIFRRYLAGEDLADIAERQVVKEVAYNIGQKLRGPSRFGKDATERGYIKRGEEWLRENAESLRRVYAALDIGGGPQAVANLNDVERTIAETLNQVRAGTYQTKIDLGRLEPYEEALVAAQQQASRRGGIDRQIDKVLRRAGRETDRAGRAEALLNNAQTKLDEAIDADLAKAQAEVDARLVDRGDALDLKATRQIQADNAKAAAGQLRAATDEVIAAEREFRSVQEAIRRSAREVRRIRNTLNDVANRAKTATGKLREALQDRVATLEAQLSTAVEQDNLLQSSLNERLGQASARMDAAEEAYRRARVDVEAFAVRQRPQDVGVPRRGSVRPKPQISKRQAKELQRYTRLLERAREAAARREQTERLLGRLQARQAKYVEDVDVVKPDEYMRRYPSEEAIAESASGRKAFGDKYGGLSSERPRYTRTRKIRGVPAAEVTIKNTDEPLFELNPVKVVARDAGDVIRDSNKISLSDQFRHRVVTIDGQDYPAMIDDPDMIKSLVDNPRSRVSREYTKKNMPVPRDAQVADDVAEQLDLLEGDELESFLGSLDSETVGAFERNTVNRPVLVHNSIVKDFDNAIRVFTDKAFRTKLRRSVLYLNALWARTGTATFGFISRNMLQGNLFLAGMAGALKPKDIRIWIDTLSMFKRGNRGLQRFGDFTRYLSAEEAAIFKQALEEGVITSGFANSVNDIIAEANQAAGTGIGGVVGKVVRTSRNSPLSPEFRVYQGISNANQWFENWSRMSVYRAKIRQGFAPPEAASITNRYMLNYRDLSEVNRGLRYVSPFITWTYKVVPLMTNTLLTDPKKILIPERIIEAINREGAQSEGVDLIPEWMTEGQTIVLPKALRERLPGPFGANPQVLSLDLPTTTAARTYRLPRKLLDIISREPGAESEAARAFINMMQLGGVAGFGRAVGESATGTSLFTGREYQPGEQVATPALLAPFYGETIPWEQLNVLQSLTPMLQRANLVFPRGEQAEEAASRGLLSTGAGVSLYPYTARTRNAEAYVRKLQLDALIRFMRDQGIKVPKRSNIENTGGGGTSTGGFPSISSTPK